MKRFCWLLLFLLRLFAGELLATSQILLFVLGLRFFKTIFASFPQEEIPIGMGESSSFLSFFLAEFRHFSSKKMGTFWFLQCKFDYFFFFWG